jgi:formiminotetrahydrofolate cyclodeaminase
VSLVDLKTVELLDRIASSQPTPGGGSAAALAGALGASLVAMVASMPKTRTGSDEDRRTLDEVLGEVVKTGAQLRRLVDEDAQAYDAVIAARRQPKATDEEKAARQSAIDAALKHAAEVPLQTAHACLAVLRGASAAASHGNPNAHSDAVTAAALAWAGLVGALENVRINLESQPESAPIRERIESLARAGREALMDVGLE